MQSTVEYVLAAGLQPETISSRLSKLLGSRLAHKAECYLKFDANEVNLNIIRSSYKPTWLKKTPRQRIDCVPNISA